MTLLNLGGIVKPKGLDGTVKVFSTTDFAPIRYQKGNKVILLNEQTNKQIEVTVRDYYSSQGFDYVSFEEYKSIEEIEPFIRWKIVVDKDSLPPLEDGETYFIDLIGCEVIDKTKGLIGKVIDVEEFTGRRSLRIKLVNKKELLLPYIDVFVKDVNVESKTINVELIDGMVD